MAKKKAKKKKILKKKRGKKVTKKKVVRRPSTLKKKGAPENKMIVTNEVLGEPLEDAFTSDNEDYESDSNPMSSTGRVPVDLSTKRL